MNGEIDLKLCLKIINRRKRAIIVGTLLCAVIAGGISFMIPKTYQSSLLLELGKIYLPPGSSRQEVQFIENPYSTIAVIKNTATLEEVRRKVGGNLSLAELKRGLEIVEFVEEDIRLQRSLMRELILGSTPMEIIFRGKSPEETVRVVNLIARIIIKQHDDKFLANQKALGENEKALQDQIGALERQIAAQSKYLEMIRKSIDEEKIDAKEFSKGSKTVVASDISPIEVLFLRSFSQTGNQRIADLNQSASEIDARILEYQESLAAAKIKISDLKNKLELSNPTRIRCPALLPKAPIKPKKTLHLLIGGLLGLVFMTLFVFLREYIRPETKDG